MYAGLMRSMLSICEIQLLIYLACLLPLIFLIGVSFILTTHRVGFLLNFFCHFDRTLSQLNFKYDYDNPPSFVPQELHMELRKRSPSYYAEKLFSENGQVCATPTQVQLGASDLRVPSNQGKAWFHCLKGHKEDVKMLFFPDNGHPLEQVWTQRKSLTAQLEFLVKHSKFD